MGIRGPTREVKGRLSDQLPWQRKVDEQTTLFLQTDKIFGGALSTLFLPQIFFMVAQRHSEGIHRLASSDRPKTYRRPVCGLSLRL
jgi:hypothetical protein